MESTSLPQTYNALVASKPGEKPNIESLSLPKPGTNQLLVKVAYAPLNPADIVAMKGFTFSKLNSHLIGAEGSGTVVALGENLKIPFTIGQKVHVKGPGTMGQYVLADSSSVWPVQGDLSLDEAAAHFSPGVVVYMGILAAQGGHKAAIHTVGSSNIGRMLIRYFKEKGIKTINIVRRDDCIQELKDEGADYVLNSTAADFEAKLKEIAEKEQATIAFDAIGGDFSGKVIAAQPPGSICYVYGALGGSTNISVNMMELAKGKNVSSFSLPLYVEKMAKDGKLGEFLSEVHSKLGTTLRTNVSKVFKLEEIEEALAYYKENSSKGKVLIQPNESL